MQYFLYVMFAAAISTSVIIYYAFRLEAQERAAKWLSEAIGNCNTHEGLELTADEIAKRITVPEFLKQLHGEIIIQQAYINKEEAK